MKTNFLAPIEVEILLLFSLKSKRLKWIAGLAPENKIWFYHRNRNNNIVVKLHLDDMPIG